MNETLKEAFQFSGPVFYAVMALLIIAAVVWEVLR